MIGGNICGTIQIMQATENDIGEPVTSWIDVQTVKGWLDMISGSVSYATHKAWLEESTHVFVMDYVELDGRIENENSRMMINGKVYDITFIDNPMELNQQLEIYLKYLGGQ